MQLKDRRPAPAGRVAAPAAAAGRHARISGSLAAATCALLGPAAQTVVNAQELEPWQFETATLLYGESDSRVQDFSVNAIATKEVREDSFLKLTLAVDSLTGASPSGAIANATPQTFTSPSGNTSYVVTGGGPLLDASFHDSRTAVGANYTLPLTRLTTFDIGASLSDEYDYSHTGLNARLARDFNNRNTTLSFGVAVASDTVSPVGGSPIPLSPMLGQNASMKRGDQSKDVTDFLLGLTQVINRKSIVQFNYSLTQSNGYLNDPYKILSVVDPITGDPAAGPAGSGLNLFLYESRPDAREKQSIYGLFKRDIDGDVFDISYRFMTDDWGIDSHTIDLHYRWQIYGGRYVQPHIRFYTQTAADFYDTVLFNGAPVPQFATADYRLAKFDAVTLGLKFGMPTKAGELSARVEVYQSSGTPSPGSAVGSLRGFSLYPDLTAVIAQFSYKFGR